MLFCWIVLWKAINCLLTNNAATSQLYISVTFLWQRRTPFSGYTIINTIVHLCTHLAYDKNQNWILNRQQKKYNFWKKWIVINVLIITITSIFWTACKQMKHIQVFFITIFMCLVPRPISALVCSEDKPFDFALHIDMLWRT